MQFSYIFSLVANLSFTIHFPVDSSERQEYFIFNGNNSTAHLSRQNNTLILFLRYDGQNIEYEIYEHKVTSDFSFTWKDYKINNEEMSLVKYAGQIKRLYFDTYTFISPLLTEQYEIPDSATPVFSCKEVNYGYIFFIMVLVLLTFQTKHLLPKVYKSLIANTEQKSQDSVYVEIDDIKRTASNDSKIDFYD